MFASFLYFVKSGFSFTQSVQYFVNELKDLLIFQFSVQEVQMMFCFNIIKYIISINVRLT